VAITFSRWLFFTYWRTPVHCMRRKGKNVQSVINLYLLYISSSLHAVSLKFLFAFYWFLILFFKGNTQHSWDWLNFEEREENSWKGREPITDSTHVPYNVQDMDPSQLTRVCAKRGKLKRSSHRVVGNLHLCLVYTLLFNHFPLLLSPLFRI